MSSNRAVRSRAVTDPELPRVPGKTVYLLGSGFSRPLGIPVIGDFLSVGMALLKRHGESEDPTLSPRKRKDLIQGVLAIANRYRHTLATILDREPNIEDMFCMADLLRERGSKGEGNNARGVLAPFIRAVCKRGMELHERALRGRNTGTSDVQSGCKCNAEDGEEGIAACMVPRSHFFSGAPKADVKGQFYSKLPVKDPQAKEAGDGVCVYLAFLSQLFHRAGDPQTMAKTMGVSVDMAGPAIVSLNYDLVIERKLEALLAARPAGKTVRPCFYGAKVERGHPSFKKGSHWLPLIKLHGSVNWKEVPNRACITIDEHEPDGPLIFPSWQRSSFADTVFEKLLAEARAHLRRASRIVIIGYSLPESDLYMRYLLADVLDTVEMPEIIVANRFATESDAREQVRKMIGSRAAACVSANHPEGLLGLVKSKADPSSFTS